MDPDAALADIKTIIAEIRGASNLGTLTDGAELLADKVDALDDWLHKGGFLPTAWKGAHRSVYLHFDRSESCAEAHGGEAERVTLGYDAPEGTWVQVTYNSVRTQDGAIIAELGEDGCWLLSDGRAFSDIVIEVTP